MFRYLIFDLDNTLYPKEAGLLDQINRQIDLYIGQKTKIPKSKLSKIRLDYCKKYGTTLGGMVVHYKIDPKEYFRNAYNIKIADYIKPDPAQAKILEGLDFKKVVFSNSPLEYVEEVLDTLGIKDQFEKIYDINFCNLVGKPNLSSYNEVLADLGIEGKECLFIDDTPLNVLGGEAAGITSILIGEGPVSNISWVISNLAELPMIIPQIKDKLTA